MINAKTDMGNIEIEVRGNLPEILTDLTVIMTEIYNNLENESLKEAYIKCISEYMPNLIMHENHDDSIVISEEEENDDKSIEEAADLALLLLKWRNGDDFNIPD